MGGTKKWALLGYHDALIKSEAFWDALERGQGVYVLLSEDNQPLEICFAGYSFD
jgi:hypothetical protein